MKPIRIAISLLISCAGASLPAQAAPPIADISKMDVLGIKLGDSPENVRNALSNAGFRIKRENPGESFFDLVELKVSERRGGPVKRQMTGVRHIHATRNVNEEMFVEFVAERAGSRVKEVQFQLGRPENVDIAHFKGEAVRKYGKPTFNGKLIEWCGGEPHTTGCSLRDDRAFLESAYLVFMKLERGRQYLFVNHHQAIASEVDRQAPKARPSL